MIRRPLLGLLFVALLAAIGTLFLRVALDRGDVNSNMARWRAQWHRDDESAWEGYFAVNRAIGWIGATFAYAAAVVVTVEALTGWPH